MDYAEIFSIRHKELLHVAELMFEIIFFLYLLGSKRSKSRNVDEEEYLQKYCID